MYAVILNNLSKERCHHISPGGFYKQQDIGSYPLNLGVLVCVVMTGQAEEVREVSCSCTPVSKTNRCVCKTLDQGSTPGSANGKPSSVADREKNQ